MNLILLIRHTCLACPLEIYCVSLLCYVGTKTKGDSKWFVFSLQVCDVFVATQNFPADDVDAISLKKGDLVEVLHTGPEPVK